MKLDPTVVDADTKLSIRKGKSHGGLYEPNEPNMVVDVSLAGIHELDGTVEIRIPLAMKDDCIPVAAYYDENEHDWQGVDYEYDTKNGEFVIHTGHLSTFGAFIVKRSYSQFAQIEYEYITDADPPILQYTAELREILASDAPDLKAMDWVADKYSDMNTWGIDVGYNLLQSTGYTMPFLENYKAVISAVGIAFNNYQIQRVLSTEHDKYKAAGIGMKAYLNQIVGKAVSFVGTSTMYVSMAAVAIIDYSINKFAEQAWTGRKDLYSAAFHMYYNTKGEPGYRTARQWYKLLWPAFTKSGMTEERLTALIDAYVRKYCWQFWEDQTLVGQYLGYAKNMGYSGYGGLNESIKNELSNELRGVIYNDVLPGVCEAIGRKMRDKSYDLLKDKMMKYAYMMNTIITLELKDVSVKKGEKSRYAGYRCKFKELPLAIKDPKKWECTLDDQGCGKIKFSLFSYAVAGVQPCLHILSPAPSVISRSVSVSNGLTNGEKLEKELKFKIDLNKNLIEYNTDEESDLEKIVFNMCCVIKHPDDKSKNLRCNNLTFNSSQMKQKLNGNELEVTCKTSSGKGETATSDELLLTFRGKNGLYNELTSITYKHHNPNGAHNGWTYTLVGKDVPFDSMEGSSNSNFIVTKWIDPHFETFKATSFDDHIHDALPYYRIELEDDAPEGKSYNWVTITATFKKHK